MSILTLTDGALATSTAPVYGEKGVKLMVLKFSARNRLPGVVTAVRLGNVMAQIDIRVGDNQVVAAITRDAALDLDLKEGDEVVAIFKATEVMVGKSDGGQDGH